MSRLGPDLRWGGGPVSKCLECAGWHSAPYHILGLGTPLGPRDVSGDPRGVQGISRRRRGCPGGIMGGYNFKAHRKKLVYFEKIMCRTLLPPNLPGRLDEKRHAVSLENHPDPPRTPGGAGGCPERVPGSSEFKEGLQFLIRLSLRYGAEILSRIRIG